MYSHDQLYKHICMQNHNDDTIKTIYTSHFIWKDSKGLLKVLPWEGVGPNRTATYWPPTLMAITAFLSRSPWLFNRGPTLLNAGFLCRILSPTDWTSCAPSYIIVRRPHSSCGRHKSHSFNPSTVKIIFWYSSTGCTCYLHRCISYFDSLAGSEVNIKQY